MTATTAPAPQHTAMGRLLDVIERAGNRVPHPVLMFLYLIIGVIVLSAVLAVAGVSVTEDVVVPDTVDVVPGYYEDTTQPILAPIDPDYQGDYHIETVTIPVKSLLDVEGIRFIFTSFVPNFAGFGVIAVTFVALMGAGVAEASGLMAALIRLLVAASPRRILAFVLIFVGVLSSVATDAGYLILVPLGAAAFASVGRHPLAGMAACFAGVGAIFGVNPIPGPIDAQITAITNEAIEAAGGAPLTILANYWFSIVSSIVLALVAAIITERVIEPRLGVFQPAEVAPPSGISIEDDADAVDDAAAERRGLRYALVAFLGFLALVLLLTIPPGAPLRDPATGDIIGTTPFMDSLLFIIAMTFLIAGIGYGIGARTFTSSNDVIAAVVRTFSGLAGLVFMLLMISQFIAYFNYSNLPSVLAIALAELLESAGIGALPLLIGMIVVILLLDVIMPGLIPKWAIFAPIFVPLFVQLGVPPQTGLAAYRVGDSPINVVTPLMVYLPFMVTIAQRYQKDAGIGTVIALMLPYVVILALVWTVLLIAWFVLGLPLGPGYPVAI
ncbi:MAG TPA: AbgT family transporter [Candidatus Limnocylindrales bacterium]|nr:AbgT family transporter [Candidatus Limnocylindrales bacterium]